MPVLRGFPLTELSPGEVVERAQGVGDAPMRNIASGVGLERLLKAFDPFLMVEAKAPIQSEVEPALCLGRTGGDMAGVTPEVEVLHAFPVQLDALVAAASIVRPHVLSQRDRRNAPYGAASDPIRNRFARVRR